MLAKFNSNTGEKRKRVSQSLVDMKCLVVTYWSNSKTCEEIIIIYYNIDRLQRVESVIQD